MNRDKVLTIALVALTLSIVLTSGLVVYLMLRPQQAGTTSQGQADSAYPAQAGGSEPSIVYMTDHSEENDRTAVYVMDVDGSNRRRLAGSENGICVVPRFSPDGQRIAFSVTLVGEDDEWGSSDDELEIWVMRADGSEQLRLSDLIEDELVGQWTPVSWSPDGARIALPGQVERGSENSNIYILASDGSALEHTIAVPLSIFGLQWSPSGDALLFGFETDTVGNGAAMLSLSDGQVTTLSQDASSAAWSPDGTEIAVAAELAQQIIIMGRDGVATWSVQLDQGFPSAVAWSPDGTRIAATAASSYQQGPEILYIITAETGERVAVSQNEIEFFFIAWSPDSTRVLYTDVIDRAEEADLPAANLWIYELASGEFVQLTDSPWHDGLGDWSP